MIIEMFDYEITFLKSLLFTLSIEIPVLLLLQKIDYFRCEDSQSNFRVMAVGLFATMLTLPYLWFILPVFLKNNIAYIVLSEAIAVVVESFIYYLFFDKPYGKVLLISLICNGSSYLLGLIVF